MQDDFCNDPKFLVGLPLAVRGGIRIPDGLADSAPGHQESE
jgi:hypothetical protein